MATIKYCLPITRFDKQQCHQVTKVIEQVILPKLGFNRHMPKAVLYGPRLYGGKQLMNMHTEQTTLHLEIFIAHTRGGQDINTLQRILLNKQQLATGAKDYLFLLPYSRYSYSEHNEVTFLWRQLSALNIQLDIQGAWRPSIRYPQDVFIMEKFVDKGYPVDVLIVLNDVRVYMKVIVLSGITSNQGRKMAQWAMQCEVNLYHKWVWSPRRRPTSQNMKVWRDCIRGTFMKRTDDLLLPILDRTMVTAEITAHLHFDYTTMRRLESLQDTILQYPPELLYLMGKVQVTDEEGLELMVQLSANNASAGSDGSVKNGIGGHSFCITNNTFTKKIWGSAQTVGQTSDITSLRAKMIVVEGP